MRLLSPDDLAAVIIGSGARRSVLLDEPDVKLGRFCQTDGRFAVDGLSHNVLTMQLGAGARVTLRIDNRTERIAWQRGAFNIVPAATPVMSEWQGTNDIVSLWLKPSFCARALDLPSFDIGPGLALRDEPVGRIIRTLSETIEQGEPFGPVFREGLLVSLVAYLSATHRRAAPQVRGGLAAYKRRRVLDYIEANIAEDIRLAELAALAGMSERHFGTSFKRSIGLPPYLYVIERRLLLAKNLLAGDNSVTAIALQCGFKSSAHFATAFRRRFGLTPTAFRIGR